MEMLVIRKKDTAGNNIVLPSVVEGAFDDPIPEHVDRKLVEFIRNNFKKAECSKFRPEQSSSSLCKCGKAELRHSEDARDVDSPGFPEKPLKCYDVTDAFGEINFGGRNTSKYIRASDQTEPSLLLDLMCKHWKMEKPNLLISVTGGAQNFTMKPRLKEVFRHGFIKAAQSTGAWIITGGTNAGVMKHVGEAVRDYTLKHGSKNIITTIGVACWGCVLNREHLVSQMGCWPANYTSVASTSLTGGPKDCPLDPNHTHFVLVDDGTCGKYGIEIILRSELERAISNSPTFSDREMLVQYEDNYEAVSVPVVCVVLEGGPNTLETVKNAIACGTPAIIVQGSGRVADILAYAYNNAIEEEIYAEDQLGKKQKQLISIMEDWLEKELREKIVNELKPKTSAAIDVYLENVRACITNRDFMTVFKLDGKDSASDIDITILKALLKSNKGKRIDQLKLALAWNRADVAREQIFTDEAVFEPEDLYDLLYKATIQNKVEFVKLLISKGVSLKEFVTMQRVLQLYNEPLTDRNCRHLKKLADAHTDGLVSLKHVGEFIKSLVGHFYEPTFCKSPFKDVNPRDYLGHKYGSVKGSKWGRQIMGTATSLITMKSHFGETLGISSSPDKPAPPPEFDDPANVLFMWCVLVHQKEMSLVFWDIGKEDIAIALTAQHILKSLQEKEQDSEFAVELLNQTEFFGNLAVGVLNECYMTDQSKATLLLVRQMSSFGDTTVLKMAVMADNKEFVAHPACQNLLSNIWTDRLSDDNSYIRIILALFLPMFSPFLLRFRQKEIKQKTPSEMERKSLLKKFLRRRKSRTPDVRLKQSLEDSQVLFHEGVSQEKPQQNFVLRYWDQLESFFKAPFTTFCYNCMSFFAFLLLYGIIMLTDFYPITRLKPTIEIKEMILIAWISTFLLEEFRQFLVTESSNPRQKLLNYVSDPWNMADLIAISTYFVGLGLRFVPPAICDRCFYWARIVLAFNLMMFFLRVLHMFSVHQQLGPKLVMIKQMMVDLFYFVIIIMVFIASYGITSQVILFPNQPLNIHLAKDVLSDAWWSVYGEMNIDLVSGKNCETPDGFENFDESFCFAGNGTCSSEQCAAYGFEHNDRYTCLGKEKSCPANDWIVPILLAIYALITNVMMLNLLIAMFSNTFATIQGQTNVVWKMQRYHLIQEFESRPIWPPPLIVIGHMYQALKYLIFDRCCWSDHSTKLGFRMKLNKMEEKELINWENIYAEEYLLRTDASDEASMERQVKETFKKSDDIMFKLDQLSESNILSQTTNFTSIAQPKLPPMLEERFSFIEEQLKRNAQALTLLINHLDIKQSLPQDITDVDEARKRDMEDRQEEIKRKKDKEMERFRQEMNLHRHSRYTLYPSDCEVVIRAPVPDNKVLVDVEFPSYKPAEYTSQNIIEGNYDETQPSSITFNVFDRMKNFDRTSQLGMYRVVDHYPVNPMGRTGLKGRGVLRRWGPNPMYKIVLTKWCKDVSKSAKSTHYLLFLAVPGPSHSKKKAIPELLYPHTTTPSVECMDDVLRLKHNNCRDAIAWLSSGGNHVSPLTGSHMTGNHGYYDDPRNTDNAWLEYYGDHFHDNTGDVLTDKNLAISTEDHRCTWERIHSNLDAYASDLNILKRIATKLGASF